MNQKRIGKLQIINVIGIRVDNKTDAAINGDTVFPEKGLLIITGNEEDLFKFSKKHSK